MSYDNKASTHRQGKLHSLLINYILSLQSMTRHRIVYKSCFISCSPLSPLTSDPLNNSEYCTEHKSVETNQVCALGSHRNRRESHWKIASISTIQKSRL